MSIAKHEKVFAFLEVNMDFKDKIRALRKEAGLTQKAAAEQIGVTYRTYQNYEIGASSPSAEILSKIAEMFNVSMDMLSDTVSFSLPSAENEELSALLAEMQALFLGGRVRDEDKKYVIEALTDAFWRTKEIKKQRE